MATLRLVGAFADARPYVARRYDVFGPKVDRRITLFGYLALNAWLQLEFDPNVVAYCERPLYVTGCPSARLVDFWVKMTEQKHLLFCQRAPESRPDASLSD